MIDGKQMLDWWRSRHWGSLELMALSAGVTVRTVEIWERRGRVPRSVAALIEQIKNGPAVRTALHRTHTGIRAEWKELFFPILDELQELHERAREAREAEWSRIWQLNRTLPPDQRQQLPN